MKICEMNAAELSSLLEKKELSAVEVTRSFLDQIELLDPGLKAFITRTPRKALDQAAAVDRKRLKGEKLHQLAGVPVAVKDNISTEGIRTTCASKILDNYIPPYNASVIETLEKAGMPLLGKTNMDEFAMGSSTENSAFFPTSNPWDPGRVPGGSSGGSAVAVAAAMAPLALGSDTGGSIRQPASFCGLVGLRPTYGRVSRYGLIAFASSLDQIGPFARSAEDAALLFQLISGYDPRDSTCLDQEAFTWPEDADKGVRGLKVGLISQNLGSGFAPEITGAVKSAAALMEKHGAAVEEVSLPRTDYGLAAYYLIAPSEASSNLGRYDGVRYGSRLDGSDIDTMFSRTRGRLFGPEVKRRIMIGTYALSAGYFDAFYLQALKVRTLIRRDYLDAFNEFDLLLGATTPTPAFKLGEKSGDPMQMYLSDICNINDALAGLPSLSLPCGFSEGGLPIGMQFTGPPLAEKLLFRAARFFEEAVLTRPCLPALCKADDGERGRAN